MIGLENFTLTRQTPKDTLSPNTVSSSISPLLKLSIDTLSKNIVDEDIMIHFNSFFSLISFLNDAYNAEIHRMVSNTIYEIHSNSIIRKVILKLDNDFQKIDIHIWKRYLSIWFSIPHKLHKFNHSWTIEDTFFKEISLSLKGLPNSTFLQDLFIKASMSGIGNFFIEQHIDRDDIFSSIIEKIPPPFLESFLGILFKEKYLSSFITNDNNCLINLKSSFKQIFSKNIPSTDPSFYLRSIYNIDIFASLVENFWSAFNADMWILFENTLKKWNHFTRIPVSFSSDSLLTQMILLLLSSIPSPLLSQASPPPPPHQISQILMEGVSRRIDIHDIEGKSMLGMIVGESFSISKLSPPDGKPLFFDVPETTKSSLIRSSFHYFDSVDVVFDSKNDFDSDSNNFSDSENIKPSIECISKSVGKDNVPQRNLKIRIPQFLPECLEYLKAASFMDSRSKVDEMEKLSLALNSLPNLIEKNNNSLVMREFGVEIFRKLMFLDSTECEIEDLRILNMVLLMRRIPTLIAGNLLIELLGTKLPLLQRLETIVVIMKAIQGNGGGGVVTKNVKIQHDLDRMQMMEKEFSSLLSLKYKNCDDSHGDGDLKGKNFLIIKNIALPFLSMFYERNFSDIGGIAGLDIMLEKCFYLFSISLYHLPPSRLERRGGEGVEGLYSLFIKYVIRLIDGNYYKERTKKNSSLFSDISPPLRKGILFGLELYFTLFPSHLSPLEYLTDLSKIQEWISYLIMDDLLDGYDDHKIIGARCFQSIDRLLKDSLLGGGRRNLLEEEESNYLF